MYTGKFQLDIHVCNFLQHFYGNYKYVFRYDFKSVCMKSYTYYYSYYFHSFLKGFIVRLVV